MEHRSSDERPEISERQQFASALSNLKGNGSALLVVGTVPDEKYVQACSWMLGDDSAGPRRRLFITTDSDVPSVSDRFTAEYNQLSSEMAKRITWSSQARSIAALSPSASAQIPSTHVHGESLAKLGTTISEEISELDELADGLDPAELRVCFDSLEPLLSDYNRESVFQFLHILIGRLRSVRAMGHFHLPVKRNSELVQLLSELFDATIELRIADTRLQQRWHLHDAEITSSWLPASSP